MDESKSNGNGGDRTNNRSNFFRPNGGGRKPNFNKRNRPMSHNGNRINNQGGSRRAKRQPSLRSTIRQTRSIGRLQDQNEAMPIPSVGKNIRIVPLGGVQEIGKNMTAIEIGQDIIVIDAGLQFRDTTTPGVDYILPNTKYLEERKDKVRGLFITHGHLDHIGAIPYVLEKLGNPSIYSRQFGALMIQKKMEDFPHLPKPDMKIIDGDEVIRVGNLKIESLGSFGEFLDRSLGCIFVFSKSQ